MSPTKLSKQNIARVVACSMMVIAISAPATFAYSADAGESNQQQVAPTRDLRSPDAQDPSAPQPVAVVTTDLRSPDAQDPSAPQPVAVVTTDLRSPDAQDPSAPQPVAVVTTDLRSPDARGAAIRSPSEPAPAASSEPTGFDWSTAGISVAALIGLLLFALAAATMVRHGRGPLAR